MKPKPTIAICEECDSWLHYDMRQYYYYANIVGEHYGQEEGCIRQTSEGEPLDTLQRTLEQIGLIRTREIGPVDIKIEPIDCPHCSPYDAFDDSYGYRIFE